MIEFSIYFGDKCHFTRCTARQKRPILQIYIIAGEGFVCMPDTGPFGPMTMARTF